MNAHGTVSLIERMLKCHINIQTGINTTHWLFFQLILLCMYAYLSRYINVLIYKVDLPENIDAQPHLSICSQ